MVSQHSFRQLALSLPQAVEMPHFDKTSFRVKGKIFATLRAAERIAVLKLSLLDQSVFCSSAGGEFAPVPGAWGTKGFTTVDLSTVRKDMLSDALTLAHQCVSGSGRKA